MRQVLPRPVDLEGRYSSELQGACVDTPAPYFLRLLERMNTAYPCSLGRDLFCSLRMIMPVFWLNCYPCSAGELLAEELGWLPALVPPLPDPPGGLKKKWGTARTELTELDGDT